MSALGGVDPDTLARFAGEHALAGFGVALLALLVAVPLAWRLVLRHGVPRSDSRIPPKTLLVIQLMLSFAVIAGGAALFAAIADELGAEEELGRLD
jgi:undecaprenyl-diphosphatase